MFIYFSCVFTTHSFHLKNKTMSGAIPFCLDCEFGPCSTHDKPIPCSLPLHQTENKSPPCSLLFERVEMDGFLFYTSQISLPEELTADIHASTNKVFIPINNTWTIPEYKDLACECKYWLVSKDPAHTSSRPDNSRCLRFWPTAKTKSYRVDMLFITLSIVVQLSNFAIPIFSQRHQLRPKNLKSDVLNNTSRATQHTFDSLHMMKKTQNRLVVELWADLGHDTLVRVASRISTDAIVTDI